MNIGCSQYTPKSWMLNRSFHLFFFIKKLILNFVDIWFGRDRESYWELFQLVANDHWIQIQAMPDNNNSGTSRNVRNS